MNTNGYVTSVGQGNAFIQLLVIWRGSLYKLLWRDLLIYLVIYYIISFTYRFGLNMDQRRTFENVVRYCESQMKNIPISFLLGFFVSGVIARWYQMYMYIPSLAAVAFHTQTAITDKCSAQAQNIRVNIMRYLNLAWILSMRTISSQVANRFREPENFDKSESDVRQIFENINKDKIVRKYYKKLITEKEILAMKKISDEYSQNKRGNYIPEYWIPLHWCTRLIEKSFEKKFINDKNFPNLLKDVDDVRKDIMSLLKFSSITIPLVYTQVVIIATYSYFMLQLMSSQFVRPHSTKPNHEIDMVFPFFTIIHFLFLLGWLKVAMCVFNPFGNDDQDFPTSDMLNSNLEVTKRSACAQNDMYPENLHIATVDCKEHPDGVQVDFLEEESDDERTNSKISSATHDMTHLEIDNSRFETFRKCFTCVNYCLQKEEKEVAEKNFNDSPAYKQI